MFTGIITDIGKITRLDKTPETIRLSLSTSYPTDKITMGASISCNGVCLTVVKKEKNILEFDLSPETVRTTCFQFSRMGDEINLEQALKMGDELGGHLVSGHVDGIATVQKIEPTENNWKISFNIPSNFKKYFVPKGSVTINGVSLTVNKVENEIFEVNVIPHSLEKTNLKYLKQDSKVNFEIDMLARYLEKLNNK